MHLDKQQHGTVLLVSIGGEFDTLDVDRFSAEISEAMDAGFVRVGLQLEKLTFINSTALGSLLREQKRLNQGGGDLACCALSPFAAKNFKLLGLDRKIRCFATVPEAVAYLKTVGALGVGLEGEHRVSFSFPDEASGAPARTGELRTLHEGGLAFVLENLEGLDVPQVFRTGRAIRVAFRLPLYHPTHEFKVDGVVGAVDAIAGKKVTVRVAFEEIGELEREAIAKFVADLKFIQEEVAPGEDAAAAG